MQFPRAKTLLEHISHSESTSIIQKGLETPFTFENLYEAPKEHTYRGNGKAFEEYNNSLFREGKQISFWKFILFCKKVYFWMHLTSIVAYSFDFVLPLVLERFLRWISEKELEVKDGVCLLGILILICGLRMLSAFQYNYCLMELSVTTKNALEVKNHKILFFKNFC